MEKVIILHDTGTSDLKAPDGSSWIDFWKKNTKRDIPKICPCCKHPVNKENFVGAHVIHLVDLAEVNRNKYLTPTCESCNNTYKNSSANKHPFEVENEMLLPV